MPPQIVDTDLLLLNRGDVTYKVTAEDLSLTGPKPINPGPGQVTFAPAVSGNGTVGDPYRLTASTVGFGETVYSNEEITIVGQRGGDLVDFVDQNAATNGDRYKQPVGTIIADTPYVTKLRFLDVPALDTQTSFIGSLKLADTVIYFQWNVLVEADTEPPVFNSVTLVATGTDEAKRFEDQSFNATLDITEGKPVSTKLIGYKVEGRFEIEGEIQDNTTLYLETNNLRQVTGLSSSPVYYETTATSDAITFDLATGTGLTWDQELPDGTTIQSCAFASNEAAGGGRSPETGTIDFERLQPGSTTVRNLTQEEVDTTKLLFETREFRKIKHEQDSGARAAELRAGFEARGFTTAEIDEVLD